jgi:hypothetical protein
MPLLSVRGRGEAAMPIGVVVNSNRAIQDTYGPSAWCTTQGVSCHVYYINPVGPITVPGWPINGGVYGLVGFMEIKSAENVTRGVVSNAYAVTRLYFDRPDGTTTELVDTNYYGQPVLTTCNIYGADTAPGCSQMANRGRTFVSDDGS